MTSTGAYSKDRMNLTITESPGARFTVRGDQPQEGAIPPRIFGNFLEHLGLATQGGILAQALNNPALTMDDNLSDTIRRALVENGRHLEQIARLGEEKAKEAFGGWRPMARGTGFSVAALDDMRADGLPFPWKAEPAIYAKGGRKGRVGHGVRLTPKDCAVALSQGVFLPHHRVLSYEGYVWASAAQEMKLRVELATRCGQVLAARDLPCPLGRWTKLPFTLELPSGKLNKGEPVDFRIVAEGEGAITIDRACLTPTDHVKGFDPDVLALTKKYAPPILRGPGGNFVSGYHFWHGIGDLDYRQTFKNPAWSGIETNFFGPDEFLTLCELIGSEPHITINLGDGIPEEAAAWVEYINGSADTHWGAKRAANGHPEPYGVKVWEVGNEIYGEWQIGNCGDTENARRYRETAAAMLAVDPTICLIGNGTEFDFYDPDMHWNRTLIQEGGESLNCVALHALPGNTGHPNPAPLDEVWKTLQAQPARWERVDLPNLLDIAKQNGKDITVAITEWGILGAEPFCPSVGNSGDSVFGASFYNMCLRLKEYVFETNATALYHGGCVKKAGIYCYADPQMEVIRRYTQFANGTLYPMDYEGPAYDAALPMAAVPATPAIPDLDAVCVRKTDGQIVLALVNRHPAADRPTEISLEGFGDLSLLSCEAQQGFGMNDVNTPLNPDRVAFAPAAATLENGTLKLTAPARGVVFAVLG